MSVQRVLGAVMGGLITWAAAQPGLTAPAEAPIVQTASGPVRGAALADGRVIFQGVPFAAAPVGALRWRAPEPAKAWTEVRDATAAGPACPQQDLGWNHEDAARGKEDCLYLDVATPDLKPGAKLPVMVWIHGGANWAGSGRGTVLSKLTQRGVVLVAIQYRLGPLGYLSHPALSAEQGGSSGNYALMDQIAALQWVKANIARFGGDPERITIFGESAGAIGVGQLNLIPATEGLFVRSIQQSGTAGVGMRTRTLAENETLGRQIAQAAGVAAGPGELASLRALTPEQLIAAQKPVHVTTDVPGDDFIWVQAVADGKVLNRSLDELQASGRRLRPLLIGWNAKEFDALGSADTAKARRVWGEAGVAALQSYGAAEDPRFGAPGLRMTTDATFQCPSRTAARNFTASGAPVWLYLFDVPLGGPPVHHAGELPSVFDDAALGAPGVSLQAYWVNFARTGDPNGPGLPAWPHYGAERAYMDFRANGPTVDHASETDVCSRLVRP